MVSECDVHEEASGRCRTCRGDGGECSCGNNPICNCEPCPDCKGSGECPKCVAWMEDQSRYWRAYFGKAIQDAAQQAQLEREDYGRELTDEERMSAARRLK